ncbi:hypothetical protein RBB79_11635 [Tunturiibacter empetritectus]|uniref:Uncharacterized protein n=1 Tax=Tunturiibacter lichenicola TaxID=2051959 RepID=A0A852VG81_9BACT|nr:hypothetical protein [Edaphobacter lichenicola]NYF90231.1 hypothetical protein [Edaphobacter lichenicola]
MPTVPHAPESLSSPLPRLEPSDAAVRATLHLILQSQPFRTSRQCQDLLSYVVKHSLHGDDASLRERILGIEVFGRAANYDTSEDPVVRMRAADVRKRLAQFYQAVEPNSHANSDAPLEIVHIELKPGSYRVTFHYEHALKEDHGLRPIPVSASALDSGSHDSTALTAGAALIAPPVLDQAAPLSVNFDHPPQARRAGVYIGLAAVIFSLLVLAGWKAWTVRSNILQQRFWAPLTRSGQPVLVYVGSNAVYRFTPAYLARYKKERGIEHNGPEFFVDLPKGGTIQADDLTAVKDTFVSVADLAAVTQVVSLMKGWDKPYNLRSASDITIGDIRNTPTVLVGGFNDTWTLETTKDLPYSFRDGVKIENRADPAHSWKINEENGVPATEDYALISRLQHSNTGGPVLSIGGIGSFGTQAAAEFVTSPDRMNDLLKSAPPGWEGKNMQAVLRIKVVGFAPVAVDVAATSYW